MAFMILSMMDGLFEGPDGGVGGDVGGSEVGGGEVVEFDLITVLFDPSTAVGGSAGGTAPPGVGAPAVMLLLGEIGTADAAVTHSPVRGSRFDWTRYRSPDSPTRLYVTPAVESVNTSPYLPAQMSALSWP
eukprot:TRINITY_DN6222_c0_g1_i1.p2 TRINITY_DN6222_c0_g1~~TRINITY_DN6222_c0_g1_i1.p2  ORF type:complete len:131 (-),score=5.94 TRINITY_DN6222_c0_g1_i1:931-1323(-)